VLKAAVVQREWSSSVERIYTAQRSTRTMDDPPVTVGHYRLRTTLGIGAFGKVKRKLL
jgi:hypothetical protein